MSDDRATASRRSQPDYGDGERPPETLVVGGRPEDGGAAPPSSGGKPAGGSPHEPPAGAADGADRDRYRAPDEGGEGPPAAETPAGEPMDPLAPAVEDQQPPFTDPFGPTG